MHQGYLILALTALIGAQQPDDGARSPPGVPTAPTVDGDLTDAVWRRARRIGDLTLREPRAGDAPASRTEVRVLVAADTLYVGVIAFSDAAPVSRIRRRDRVMRTDESGVLRFGGDDAIAILVDPDLDRKTGFVFATNPIGAQFDAQVGADGSSLNVAWTGLWSVAARVEKAAWTAEFAIPLATLRAGSDPNASWGFNVERVERASNEYALWRGWARGSGGLVRVSNAGPLQGLAEGSSASPAVELRPSVSVLSGAERAPGFEGSGPSLAVGLDVSHALRPGFVIDATLNPDFARAGSDDERINLTRFDLFRPERRAFFLENASVFESGSDGFGGPPPIVLFFSRRIGLRGGRPVPVDGGLRASGRLGSHSLGLLGVATGARPDVPRQTHWVARVTRDAGSRGFVGALATLTGAPEERNVVTAFDASLWATRSLNLEGMVARTSTEGSGSGLAYRLALDAQGDRFGVSTQHVTITEGADAGLGFVERTDIRRSDVLLRFTARPRTRVRSVELHALGRLVTRVDGTFQDWAAGPALHLTFPSEDRVSLWAVRAASEIRPFDLAGRVPVPGGRYRATTLGLVTSTSPARALSAVAALSYAHDLGGVFHQVSLTGRAAVGVAVAEGAWTLDRVRLPAGSFSADVFSLATTWSPHTRLSSTIRVQHNTLDARTTLNGRVGWRYRPGSEVLFAVEEVRSGSGDSITVLVLEVTWTTRL